MSKQATLLIFLSAVCTSSTKRITANTNARVPSTSSSRDLTNSSSQPLRTLEKLQAMLDDTDYVIASSSSSSSSSSATTTDSTNTDPTISQTTKNQSVVVTLNSSSSRNNADKSFQNNDSTQKKSNSHRNPSYLSSKKENFVQNQENARDQQMGRDIMNEREDDATKVTPLWTSKDRSKYKRQQRRWMKTNEHQQGNLLQLPWKDDNSNGQSHNSMNDESWQESASTVEEEDIGTEETDDGLGYTLPVLPVYMSDGEISTEDDEGYHYQGKKSNSVPRQGVFNHGTSISGGIVKYQDRKLQNRTTNNYQEHQIGYEKSHQSTASSQYPLPQYQPSPNIPNHQSSQSHYYGTSSVQDHQPSQSSAGPYPYQPWFPYPPYMSHLPPNQLPLSPPPQHSQINESQQQQIAQQQYAAWAAAMYHQYNGFPLPPPTPTSALPYPYDMSNKNQIPYSNPNPFSSPFAYLQHMQQQAFANLFNPRPSNMIPGQYVSQGSFPLRPWQRLPTTSSTIPSARDRVNRYATREPSGNSFTAVMDQGHDSFNSPTNATHIYSTSRGTSEQDTEDGSLEVNQPISPSSMHNMYPHSNDLTGDNESKGKHVGLVMSRISLDSAQKILLISLAVLLLSYCAVSPRTLAVKEYNSKFQENLKIVAIAWVVPVIYLISVLDPRENDLNSLVNSFYTSFTIGYVACFLLELLLTTVLRLGVFAALEPAIFSLTPDVPVLVLPWTLREHKYRPKRITLFAADFVTSCIGAPIVEEWMKLKVIEWTVSLPKNFQWSWRRRTDGKLNQKRKKRKFVREAIVNALGESETTNINSYAAHMLAVSLGLKLSDSTRRILMYTKRSDEHKAFYSLCRGIFPVHELCGAMTTLQLAKRDVLGLDMPLWKMLAPAVFIHGMANFRGMKPIFKWNSSKPGSEMQLSPLNFSIDSSLGHIFGKSFPRIMWLIILMRVLGYCIKNYYMIGRQALKRTTTYSGKYSAFSAELAATEMLKKK